MLLCFFHLNLSAATKQTHFIQLVAFILQLSVKEAEVFDKAETDGQIWRINSPTSTCDWMVFLLLMVLVVTIMSDDDASRCNTLVLVLLEDRGRILQIILVIVHGESDQIRISLHPTSL